MDGERGCHREKPSRARADSCTRRSGEQKSYTRLQPRTNHRRPLGVRGDAEAEHGEDAEASGRRGAKPSSTVTRIDAGPFRRRTKKRRPSSPTAGEAEHDRIPPHSGPAARSGPQEAPPLRVVAASVLGLPRPAAEAPLPSPLVQFGVPAVQHRRAAMPKVEEDGFPLRLAAAEASEDTVGAAACELLRGAPSR